MGVTPHASVEEFFHEVVTDALSRRSLSASAYVEHYLVSLLGEFAHQRITDEPLSVKLAMATSSAERVSALKEVGDTTLYVAGFFADSLERKLINADYYVNLGVAAYNELARRMSASRGAVAVYEELAANFPTFVEVLTLVSQQVNVAGSDVGELYQSWLETRAEWIERRLRAMGVAVAGPEIAGKAIVH